LLAAGFARDERYAGKTVGEKVQTRDRSEHGPRWASTPWVVSGALMPPVQAGRPTVWRGFCDQVAELQSAMGASGASIPNRRSAGRGAPRERGAAVSRAARQSLARRGSLHCVGVNVRAKRCRSDIHTETRRHMRARSTNAQARTHAHTSARAQTHKRVRSQTHTRVHTNTHTHACTRAQTARHSSATSARVAETVRRPRAVRTRGKAADFRRDVARETAGSCAGACVCDGSHD
jgi:hypothetical protein